MVYGFLSLIDEGFFLFVLFLEKRIFGQSKIVKYGEKNICICVSVYAGMAPELVIFLVFMSSIQISQ